MENEISKSNDRMSNFTKKLALLADDLNIFENTEVGSRNHLDSYFLWFEFFLS
jgi:hypothetical protein